MRTKTAALSCEAPASMICRQQRFTLDTAVEDLLTCLED